MRVVLAAPRSATAPTTRIGNSGLQATAVRRSTHRRVAATICPATASSSIHPRHRRATTRTPRPRRPNPHSDRGTAARSPSAVSSLGGFRTPALGIRGTVNHRAGIRNPSHNQTLVAARKAGAGSGQKDRLAGRRRFEPRLLLSFDPALASKTPLRAEA